MRVIRLQDIAEKLNISKVAVSKALRDHTDISLELKKRVRETALSMGYLPNTIAKNFKARKSFTIGIVVPNITNPFFAHIVNGIIGFCSENEYSTLVTISNENPDIENQNIRNLFSLQVDGLLICITHSTMADKLVEEFNNSRVPLVFFDRLPERNDIFAISSNQTKAAFDATKYLIQSGYNRIAFINGPENLDISKKRFEGFEKAFKESGLSVDNNLIKNVGLNKTESEKVCNELLEKGFVPEIIFCVNDQVAAGVYRAIYNKGLKIPDNIGVIAFGHQEFANSLTPALTIIEQYPEELGMEAAKLLIEVIADKTKPKTILNYTTTLISGQSILVPKKQ